MNHLNNEQVIVFIMVASRVKKLRYGTSALSKFCRDTELVLYPLQDKLTLGDKSLDLSAFKLSRLFFSLLSLGSSSCWRSYRAQLRLRILKGMEYGRYGVSKVFDTAYQGFLGVGTTHRYAVSSLMDTTYWLSEQLGTFVSSHMSNLHPIRTAPGSAGCECEYRAEFPWGSLPRDERPPPGSYSMEDAKLINENQGCCDVAEVDSGLNARGPPVLTARARSKRVRHSQTRFVEATSDSSAPVTHAVQSPPQTNPKVFEGMSVGSAYCEEVYMVTRRRSQRWWHAESQLADAKLRQSLEVISTELAEEKMRVEKLLEKQEEKLRKLSIEYDEELYPHLLSAIAKRRWLISHGLRLAAMSTLESQEVKQSFKDVVKCALARGRAEAVEELHEKKLLTVPTAQRDQDYPIDVIMAGLTLARHATEGAEAQPDYFLKPDVAQLQLEEAGDAAYQVGSSECIVVVTASRGLLLVQNLLLFV
ncbi:hypothetical protein Tco_0668052 [Tanacetum coccineum]